MNLKLRHFLTPPKLLRYLLAGVASILLAANLSAQTTPVVSSGLDFTAIVDDSGDLYVYGANSPEGPRRVDPEGVWRTVSVSPTNHEDAHILAIRMDGTLWAWGANSRGQLGNFTVADSEVPVSVSTAFSDWTAVACGEEFSIGLRENGEIYVWGDNTFGQIGVEILDKNLVNGTGGLIEVGVEDSPENIYNSPVRFDSANTYLSIAAGITNGVAIRDDGPGGSSGTMHSWGYGPTRQLGLASTPFFPHITPQQIDNSLSWTRVFSGADMHFALRGGELYSWGAGLGSQDGLSRTTSYPRVPTRVGNFTDWTEIAIGRTHALGLRSNGSLYGWGVNTEGQLGFAVTGSSTARKHEPFLLLSGQTFQAIAAGSSFSSIVTDGVPIEVKTAGINNVGQLGTGTTQAGSDFSFENDTVDFGILNTVDLALQNLSIDENPAFPGVDPTTNLIAGENLFVSLDLANIGGADLTQDFDLGVRLSPVPFYDHPLAIPLTLVDGERITTDIDSEESVAAGFRVALPATLDSGEYYLVFRGDAQLPRELDENLAVLANNDIASEALSFVPDLTAEITVTTTEFTLGGNVNSVLMIDNVGAWSTTVPFDITAVLSPTAFYDSPSAIPLTVTAGGTVTEAIDPNGELNAFVTVSLPVSLPDGCYFLIYRLDDAGVLGETVVANNDILMEGQLCLGSALADLVVSNVEAVSDPLNPSAVPANNLVAGGQLVVSIDLENIGDADILPTFDLDAVLSRSDFFDDPDAIPLTFVDGRTVEDGIVAGGSITVGARFILPASLENGVYNLIIRGDEGDIGYTPVLSEVTRVNNDGTLADLQFIPDVRLDLEVLTDSFAANGIVNTVATVTNVGTWTADETFFLSGVLVTTPNFDGLDPETLTITTNPVITEDLDPGESIDVLLSFLLPSSIDPDCYYLAVRADDARLLNEAVLDNNDAVTEEICFGLEAADLVVSSVTAEESPLFPGVDPLTNLIAGGELSVAIELSNIGDADIADDFELQAFLSPSAFYFDPDAVELTFLDGQLVTSDIAAEASVTVGARLGLPAAIESGAYNLIILGDSGEVLTEVTRVNNDGSLDALQFVPDLALALQILTEDFVAGATVDAIATLQNVGSWSVVEDFDLSAVMVTTAFFEGLSPVPLTITTPVTVSEDLDPGESIDVVVSLTLPSPITDGCYYLALRADDAGVVDEVALDNNDAVTDSICFGLETADLSVSSVTAIESPLFPGVDPLTNLIAGGELSVSIDLSNVGDADISTDFELEAFLSPSAFYTDPAAIALTFLDGQTVTSDILADGAATVGARLELPAAIAPGTYNLIIVGDSGEVLTELTRVNNDGSVDGLVFVPDVALSLEVLTDSFSATGTVVDAIATIENVGSWTVSEDFALTAVMVTTPFYEGLSPQILGIATIPSPITEDVDPGESIQVQVELTLPGAIPDGCYYLAVRADDAGVIGELELGNNDAVTEAICFGLETADLVVANVTAQELPEFPGVDPLSNLIAGGEFSVSIDLSNIGDADIATDFDLQAFLSPSAFITDPEAVSLNFLDGETVITDVLAGGQITVGARLELPASIPVGDYNLIIVGDSGEVLTEATRVNNGDALEGLSFVPDVQLGLEVLTDSFAVGGTVNAIATLTNVGSWTAAPDFDLSAVLATTAFYDGLNPVGLTITSDPTITEDLNPGDSLEVLLSLTLPGSITDGCYFLAVRADDARVLSEVELANNDLVTDAICFGLETADLAIASITALEAGDNPGVDPLTNLIPGDELSLSIVLSNVGDADIGAAFELQAFLSPTAFYNDPAAVPLTFVGGATVDDVIAAGGDLTVGARVELPASLDSGTYNLILLADSGEVLTELTRVNNDEAINALTIAPDLALSIEILSDTFAAGGTVDLIATVENVGTWTTTDDFDLTGVFVTTPLYDGLAPEVLVINGSTNITDVLDPGESVQVLLEVELPAVITDDCYYLALRADDARVVDELVLPNNDFVSSSICFGLEAADLVVSNVTALDSVTNLVAGGEFSVSVALSNIGDVDITDDFDLEAVLSPSAFANDPAAVPLAFIDGETVTVDLLAGTGTTVGARFTLPASIDHGLYNLIITGDSGEVLAEATRVNNNASLDDLSFIPDVAISLEVVDDTFAVGEPINIAVTLENVGAWTASADFDVSAVLATTPFFDGLSAVAVTLGGDSSTVTPDLDPGDSIQLEYTITVPIPFVDGAYYLVFRADDARALDEVVISNNDAVAQDLLNVGVDIAPQSIEIADLTPTPGGDLNATIVLRNLGSRELTEDFDLVAVLSPTVDFDDEEAVSILFDGGDSFFTVTDDLAPLENISLPLVFDFPVGLEQGDYHLVICADSAEAVVELDETNNCIASENQFELLPDLVFTDLTGIAFTNVSPYSPGDSLDITLNIENAGLGNILEGTEFSVRVFLSPTTSTDDAGAVDIESAFLVSAPVGGFNAGDTLAIPLTGAVLPVGLGSGFYYMGAVLDVNGQITEQTELISTTDVVIREDGEANNVFVTPSNSVEVLGIDLAEALDQPGFTFTTQGDGTWFGQDSLFNFGGDAGQSPSIGGGESASFRTTFATPVLITFDWRAQTTSVENKLVYSVIGGATGIGPNEISGDTGVWLSEQRVVPAGAQVQWEYIEGVDAANDAVFVDNLDVFVVTDPELVIDGISLTEQGAIVDSGTYVLNRDRLDLNVNSRNQGTSTGATDQFAISVYLSTDRNLNRPDADPGTDDDLLLRQYIEDEIFAGGNSAVNGLSIDLPTDIAPGDYYLIAYIDDYTDEDGNLLPGATSGIGTIDEFTSGGFPGETNNIFVTADPIVQIVALPDLVVSAINPEPGYYQIRELNGEGVLAPNVIDFDFTVENRGLAPVDETVFVTILLSRDEVMDPENDYVVLEYEYAEGLAEFGTAGSSKQIDPDSVDIREDLVELGYIGERLYFGAFIDSRDAVVEFDESNNGVNYIDNDFIFSELPIETALEFDDGAGNLVTQDTEPAFDGELPWVGQTTTTIDGVDAAMSLEIGNGEVSAFETTIDAGDEPTFVTFRWRVSSQNDENGRDVLSFYIDDFNNASASIAGTEASWIRVSRLLSPGEHTLRWEYAKDPLGSAGEDRAWVDDVSFQVPNLIVESIVVDDSTAYTAGDDIANWQVTIRNTGLADVPPTPSFDLQLRISPDNTWDNGGEFELITITDNEGLAVGESRTYSEATDGALTIPDEISLDAFYFVGAYVDWNDVIPTTGSIPESDDTDNALFIVSPSLEIAPSITLNDAVDDAPATLDLTIGGVTGWFGVSDAQIVGGSSDGVDAAQSGSIGAGEESYMQVIIEGPQIVEFDWSVSSRIGVNFLEFSINGVVQESITGEVDWETKEFFIPAGTQELRWVYRKTGVAGAFEDAGWVDLLSLTPFADPELALTSLNYTPGRYVLDVTGIENAQNQLLGTEFLDITVEAENQGTDLTAPTFTVADLEVRLSTDRVYGNADDILLGTVNQVEGTLEAGDLIRFIGPIQLGDSIPEGFYYLIAKVDANELITEFDEENNVFITQNQDVEIVRLPSLRIVNPDPVTTEVVDLDRFFLDPRDGGTVAFDLDEGLGYFTEGPMRLRFDIQNSGLDRVEGTEIWTTEINLRGITRDALAGVGDLDGFFGNVIDPTINLGSFTVQELMEGRSDTKPDGDIVEVDIELALPSGARLTDIIDPLLTIEDYLWFIEVRLDSTDVIEESQIIRESPLLAAPTGIPWWIVDVDEAIAADTTATNTDQLEGLFGISFQSSGPDEASAWEVAYPGNPTIEDENLLAYAFNRNPNDADTLGGQFPGTYGITEIAGEEYMIIAFDIVTRSTDLTYFVEAADALPIVPTAAGYSLLTTIDGPFDRLTGPNSLTGDAGLIDEANVISVLDQGYSARVTVRDDQIVAGARFLQVRVDNPLDSFAETQMDLLFGITDPELNGAFDDADTDGVSNIVELLLGTDANDIGDFPNPTETELYVASTMFYLGEVNPADNGPLDDPDADGQSNLVELLRGSDPTDGSDTSTITVIETYVLEAIIVTFGSDYLSTENDPFDDLDADGESNIAELQLGSDPNDVGDTTGAAPVEIFVAEGMAQLNVLNGQSGVVIADLAPDFDFDVDGVDNLVELQLGSDPNDSGDSIGSDPIQAYVAVGMADAGALNGVNGVVAADLAPDADLDADGVDNLVELQLGSDPNDATDTAFAGLVEALIATEMAAAGVFNGESGVVPADVAPGFDFDTGGASNLAEIALSTDPNDGGTDDSTDVDADVDAFIDANYAAGTYTAAGNPDGDAFNNLEEIALGTDPLNP